MIHHIPNILSKQQVAYFRQEMAKIDWVDGKQTTGTLSAHVKNNQQLAADHPLTQQLGQMILKAVKQNALFMSAALPLEILPPYFNRYTSGESFGFHIDNAIRWTHDHPRPIRTDLSCTVFLTEPEEYQGGELVIEDTYGYHEVKLPAGDLILYPSTSIHEVSAVRSGCRVGCFFWLQSMIRDEADRYTLFNLDQSIQNLRLQLGDQHDEVIKLSSLYHNLIRKWAEL